MLRQGARLGAARLGLLDGVAYSAVILLGGPVPAARLHLTRHVRMAIGGGLPLPVGCPLGTGKTHLATDGVAHVSLEKAINTRLSHVAHAETETVDAVDLGVCKQVVHTLDVAHEDLPPRSAPRVVAKGLGEQLARLNVAVVVVVLDKLALHERLRADHRPSSLYQLQHMNGHKLTPRPVSATQALSRLVEALRETACNVLHHGLMEVGAVLKRAVLARDEDLGNMYQLFVGSEGVLFHPKAKPHAALGERPLRDAHIRILVLPLVLEDVVGELYGTLLVPRPCGWLQMREAWECPRPVCIPLRSAPYRDRPHLVVLAIREAQHGRHP
mmetsp:Transcript_4415/g.10577  ORF Transcript_4415/g.10577 Transcript_4415/m.10577 type:complete len:328 (-) Transcript_4415:48-1031(-)